MMYPRLSPVELSLGQSLLGYCGNAVIHQEVSRGKPVYRPGDENSAIYFMERGRIRIGQISQSGQVMIFQVARHGQLFGETALISGGRRNEEARAMEDSVYHALPVSKVRQALLGDERLATLFFEFLSRRIVETRQRLADMAFHKNPRRLAKTLLEEARIRGTRDNGTIHLRLGLTHEQLGQMIGTSREIVTTILNELRQHNVIDYKGSSYTIMTEKLQRYLDAPPAGNDLFLQLHK